MSETANMYYVARIDAQWQADLADMQAIDHQYKTTRYLLIVIKVFSKYDRLAPVKSIDAAAITKVFREISTQPVYVTLIGFKPKKANSFNAIFASLIKRHNIKHIASKRDKKAAVVERLNRTIKTRIWKYL